jgi:23S rRNA (guanosine2251-2'-O)-methyltransferase
MAHSGPPRDRRPSKDRGPHETPFRDARGQEARSRRLTGRGGKPEGGGQGLWLYGRHPVLAALANPRRQVSRILATAAFLERFGDAVRQRMPPELVPPETLDALLGAEAVHQGIGAWVRPLPPLAVEDLIAATDGARAAVLLVLDEITDRRNVGAILRAAAAFGAAGVIVTRHHAAAETGALAKAASGALDLVPLAEATNLRRAMEQVQAAGFWCLGLDHPAPRALGREPPPERTAWVLGAEGRGLRQLTARSCDSLVAIPIDAGMESLNVANAAAVALYEWARHHRPA